MSLPKISTTFTATLVLSFAISLSDDIWQIPQLAGSNDAPQIRFAEDIIETQGRDQGGRKSRKTRNTKNKKGPTTNNRNSK